MMTPIRADARAMFWLAIWLSGLVLCLSAGLALGAAWTKVASSGEGGVQWFVDRDSIVQDGELKRAWVRADYTSPRYDSDSRAYYTQRVQRVAVRCADESYTVTSYSLRSQNAGREEVIDSQTLERRDWLFREYAPGTIGSSIIAEICTFTRAGTAQSPIRRVADKIASANWEHIFTSDTGDEGVTKHDIDRRSVRKLANSDDLVSVIRVVPARGRVGQTTYSHAVLEIYANCAQRRWAISAYVYFTRANAVLNQNDIPVEQMEWGGVTEGTAGEQYLLQTCRDRTQVASAPTAREQRPAQGFGTAWLAESGYVITAHHVIENASTITLVLKDKRRIRAKVVTVDAVNDIAILDADFGARPPSALPISKANAPLGARVFTLGFPHPTLLGLSPKLTAGEVSSIAGLRDDPRVMQISVPVQSGNSGGPLLNLQGEVVGVISAKLSALNVLQSTGDLTQNVNYAIKGRYVSGLLSDVRARKVELVTPKPSALMETMVGAVQDSIFVVVTE